MKNGKFKIVYLLFLMCLIGLHALVSCEPGKQGNESNAKPPMRKPSIELGHVDKFQSTFLHEERELNIYLPAEYKDSVSRSYPVIYLLDGSREEDFKHIAGILQFKTMLGLMSPSILVGIENVDRRRDYSFPTTIEEDKKNYPTSGNSGAFIQFLQQEAKPYISKMYRINGESMLIGQSLGGLLATEILLKSPCSFSEYLIVSPSLWWDNQSLLNQLDSLEQRIGCDSLRVYLTVGTEGDEMVPPAKKLAAHLKSIDPAKLKIDFFPMPEEDHLTILHNAVYKALSIKYPYETEHAE